MWVEFEILQVKLFGLLLLLITMQCYNSVRNPDIAYFKECFKVHKIWLPFLSYQALLLLAYLMMC